MQKSSSSFQTNNTNSQISIVKYDKIILNQGLIRAYNPVYTQQIINLNEESSIEQSQTSSDQTDLDLIQITIGQNTYLLKCNDQGQILFSPKHYEQKFQIIFIDNENKFAIDKLAFVCGWSQLFFLDSQKYVSTLQFKGQQKQIYQKQILHKIDFLIGSHDQSSVLMVDQQRRFFIYDQNLTLPLVLEIDPSYKDILNQDNENYLSSIQSIDFIKHETGYFIYIANQKYLYKLNYERDFQYLKINQIIRIDQNKGKVQKIVAIDSNQGNYFEIVVVQQNSVDQYQLTNQFKTKNLWKLSNFSYRIAFDYKSKIIKNKLFHIIQCAQPHENDQNQLQIYKAYIFVMKD
ncbi:hypothetical protein ABPG74_018704 [Tetrahymena malaccensis]